MQPVLLNRPSEGDSKLVLLKGWPLFTSFVQEKVVRVKYIVPQKLENSPVVVVGARLRDHAYVGPVRAAKCCIVKSSLHLELFNCVWIRGRDATACRTGAQYVTHTDPIKLPIVFVGSPPMHENPVI